MKAHLLKAFFVVAQVGLVANAGLAQGFGLDEVTPFAVGDFEGDLSPLGLTFEGSSFRSIDYRNRAGTTAPVVFAQGIWVSGLNSIGEIKLSAQSYPGLGGEPGDFYNGPYTAADRLQDTSAYFRRAFVVSATDIQAHLADLADGRLDDPIRAIVEWPGRDNVRLPGPALRKDLAPFVDVDFDGIYDPYRGDYPEISGSLAAWWVMNSDGLQHESGSDNSAQVEVHGLLQGYDDDQVDGLSGALRLRYTIINQDREAIQSMRTSLWQDLDSGCSEDDYFGTLPELNAVYQYNADVTDGIVGDVCSSTPTFGDEPPVVLTRILSMARGGEVIPIDANAIAVTRSTASAPRPVGMQDPTPGREEEYYNVARGFWRDGTPLTASGTGYNTLGDVTSWMFPGNPADSTAWSSCGLDQGDSRSILSARDETGLLPGESLTIDYALMVIEDVPLPCPDSRLISDAAERISAEILARPIVSSAAAPRTLTNLEVFPNPSQGGGFTVAPAADVDLVDLTVTDAVGRTVRHYRSLPSGGRVTGLPAGIYHLAAQYAGGQRSVARAVVLE